MRTLPISEIIIGERQRKEITPQALNELKKGIVSKGLLHPPVLSRHQDGTYHLLAGERRLRAMTELHEEGNPFCFENEPVPTDFVPYTLIGELSPAELLEAEFEENFLRQNLSWIEEVEARKKIHEARLAENPSQQMQETAKEIAAKTGSSYHTEREKIAKALIISEHLDNPKVKRARNEAEALKVILDTAETKIKANLVQANLTPKNPHRLIHGDCLNVLAKDIQPGIVDTILTDPPYGMKADKMGKGEFHMYDDSPETALEICRFIIQRGFDLLKPKGLLFMFCDIDHFVTLRDHANRMAYSVWRAPIIWRKGTDGHAPWGRAGFIRTYECLLFCVKGQKELVFSGGPDIMDFKRPSRSERVHSAEKPVDLLAHLINISTLPHQVVLDPCMGSGPIVTAATRQKVRLIGVEKDKEAYDLAVARQTEVEWGEGSIQGSTERKQPNLLD